MKNPLLCLFVTCAFFSGCSKSNSTGPIFTFKANGQTYDWSGKSNLNFSRLVKGFYNDTADRYTLYSTKGQNTDTASWASVTIEVIAHRLEVKTYAEAISIVKLDEDLINYGPLTGDSVVLTITNIHDGMADGTFSVSLGNANAPLINITNGVFKNLPIYIP